MLEYLRELSPSLLLAHIIALLVIAQFFIFIIWKRQEVLGDLRGKDKIWQFIELSGIVWLMIFPPMVISSGLGIDYPNAAWTTMDAVYLINIMGKNADKYIEKRYGTHQKDIEDK